MDGYLPLAEEHIRRYPDDVHHGEEVFCLQVIRGDLDAALRTADVTARADADGGPPWFMEVCARLRRNADAIREDPAAGMRIMHAQAAERRAALGIGG